jgi:HlyD family secretion protein
MKFDLQCFVNVAARRVLMSLVCVLLAGCGGREAESEQPDEIYEVIRGSFNIVVSANGSLDAIKRYNVSAPPVGKKSGLDIIYAVEDHTPLKKDDLIIEFSDEVYVDDLEDLEINIEEKEKDLMLLEQDFQMKVADSVSRIKKATDSLQASIEAHEKYTQEDAPLEKKTLQQEVNAARQSLETKKKTLAVLKQNLLTAAMGDEETREDLQDKVDSAEIDIEELQADEEKAVYKLRIFKQYTYPQTSRTLESNVVKAEMELQKQLVDASAQRVQLERKIQVQERSLKSLMRERDDLVNTIRMLRVTAPVDGVITYGSADPRRRRREQKDITVGTSMKPSELIGTIPDNSRLVVNVDIPESSRSQVEVGMRAEMRIKALSNVKLSGTVSRISDLASHMNFWDRSSPKIYPTVISLDQTNEELRPGMTVEIDMISEQISDVIFVPIEALSAKEGRITCRVKKTMGPEERQVQIGRSSGSFVEILDGLEEGELVFLNREDLN